jgi:putative PIN family toxin of toxin-antitoxin system
MKIVVDTNVLVSALSRKSQYHWIVTQILDEKLDVYVTSEIILEYEEILTRKYSYSVANNFIAALKELPNVYFTQIYFNWQLLTDEDDNKFVDCAIAANVNYLITHDKDFKVLREVDFPKVNIVSIPEFRKIIELNKS